MIATPIRRRQGRNQAHRHDSWTAESRQHRTQLIISKYDKVPQFHLMWNIISLISFCSSFQQLLGGVVLQARVHGGLR